MNDRQLLEAAARAAGYSNFEYCELSGDEPHLWLRDAQDGSRVWNPLTDDGDALRLAVRLMMQIDIICTQVRCVAMHGQTVYELDLPEPSCAATRRAIVRAAAAIGASTGEAKA